MIRNLLNIEIPEGVERIPKDYSGFIFISDIDKTYLATHFDTLGGLIRAAFETPERKENVPGVSIVLRAVRRGAHTDAEKNPLFFISASPSQMGRKLSNKMELDGIEHDGIIFKNQLANVRRAKFKKIREHIGYKLAAFLALWSALPQTSKLVLFGDDSESDAVIFSLFYEILAKNVGGRDLLNLLTSLGVHREEATKVAWYSRQIKTAVNPIQAAFINLETGSRATYYSRFGRFIYPTENALQMALALYEQDLIRVQAVRSVGRNLALRYDFNAKDLLQSLESAAKRGLFSLGTLDKVWPILAEVSALPPSIVRSEPGATLESPPIRWSERDVGKKLSLNELKTRYSDEGRY